MTNFMLSYEFGTKPLLSINTSNLIEVFTKDTSMCSTYQYGLELQISVQR